LSENANAIHELRKVALTGTYEVMGIVPMFARAGKAIKNNRPSEKRRSSWARISAFKPIAWLSKKSVVWAGVTSEGH